MTKHKVIFDFIKISVAQKVETGRLIISNVKDNPHFPNPDVTLEDLEVQTNLLEARNIAAVEGGKEATAFLHQAEEKWDEMMRKTALYVSRMADGSESIILSAGFNLAKQRGPTNRLEFEAKRADKTGSVILRRYTVAGARAYIWQYCAGDNPATNEAEWITAQVTTRATIEINGLTPLTRYWFRCAVVTAKGTSGYTTPVMLVVI